jgi:anaerobic selenocysteine-containing dehydrogenase
MKISRREFIKITGAISALAAFADFSFKGPATTFVESLAKAEKIQATEDLWIPTTCTTCTTFCHVLVHRQNGIVTGIIGDSSSPYNGSRLCPKGLGSVMLLYDPFRLKVPLKRTNPEKGIGIDPKWKEITWDEALDEVAAKIAEARETDPNKIVWLQGHGKYVAHKIILKAVKKALKTKNTFHRSAVCESARHMAQELTWGYHTDLPDFDYCNYLIVSGADFIDAGQWNRWTDRKMLDAIERGMKLVVIDPRLSRTAAKADEWIPIIPGTDLAFYLAMAHVLIREGLYDAEFLKTYTNAPFLVDPATGYFLLRDGKELVWDLRSESAVPYDTEDADMALTGTYTIPEGTGKPAFQLFKEIVDEYTPTWASKITGIPAETIERIALEFGRAANIGSTIVLDGRTIRYRPACIYTWRGGGAAHQYGTQTCRAWVLLNMLIGNLFAAGGYHIHDIGKDMKYLSADYFIGKIKDPPVRLDLRESKYLPLATHDASVVPGVVLAEGPAKYGIEYEPEVILAYATNRPFGCTDVKKQINGYKKPFMAIIELCMNELAELADIVLPDKMWLESYHWAYQRWTLDVKTKAIRQPVVNPLNLPYQELEIFTEIAKRGGFLFGEKGVLYYINEYAMKGKQEDPYALDKNTEYTIEEILNRICLSQTKGEHGLEDFKEKGFFSSNVSVEDRYGLEGAKYSIEEFKGPGKEYNGKYYKLAFYAEQIKKVWEHVKTNYGIEHKGYDPLPKWYEPDHHKAPGEYDLYLTSYKDMLYYQSGNTARNPYAREIADENYVLINSKTAAAKGISNEDYVWVESTLGKIKVKAKVTEGIHPKVVAISYHFGHWANISPLAKNKGVNPNMIMPTKWDEMSGQDAIYDGVRVKVYKA